MNNHPRFVAGILFPTLVFHLDGSGDSFMQAKKMMVVR